MKQSSVIKKVVVFSLLFVIIMVAYFVITKINEANRIEITNFEECVAAGYPVMDSYPEQCRTLEGQTFVRDIGNEMEYIDEIRLDNPRPGQQISSPLNITGQATGNWYFEATFEVELIDANGNSLGVSFVTAEGDWMTEDFVPFAGELEFTTPTTETGFFIARNANPSGLPEHQKELRIPVRF